MPKKLKPFQPETLKINREEKIKNPSVTKINKEFLTSQEKLQKKFARENLKIEKVTGQSLDERSSFAKALDIPKDTPWSSSPFWWPFHLINRPLQAILQTINAARTGENIITKFFSGLVGATPDVTPTQALGINTKNWSGAGKFFANLGLSIVLDPVVWATFGGAALAKAGYMASTKTLKLANVYSAVSKGQKISATVAKNLGRTADDLTKSAIQFLKETQLDKIAGGVSENVIKKALIKKSGSTFAQTAINVGETLAKSQQAAFKTGFIFFRKGLKLAKYTVRKIPKISAKMDTFIASVNTMGRRFGFNFKFGYKLPSETREKLATLVSDQKRLAQEITNYSSQMDTALSSTAEAYWAVFKGQKIVPKIIQKLGKTPQEITEDAALFLKNNKKVLRADLTFTEMRGLIDEQLAIQTNQLVADTQNGFFLLENLDQAGYKIIANETQAAAIQKWLTNALDDPTILVSHHKIAEINEDLLKSLGLGPNTFENLLTDSQKTGWVVLLRNQSPKGKITPMTLKFSEAGTEINHPAIRTYLEKLTIGKITMRDDTFYQKLLKTNKNPVNLKKLDDLYQKKMDAFLQTQYETRIKSPEWSAFQKDIQTQVQKTIDILTAAPTKKSLLKQVDQVQKSFQAIEEGFAKFRTTKLPKHLQPIIKASEKINRFFKNNQFTYSLEKLFKKVKLPLDRTAEVNQSLINFLSDELFQKKILQLRNVPKLQALLYDLPKRFKITAAKFDELKPVLLKEIDQLYQIHQELRKLLKAGVNPMDLAENLTGKFTQSLKAKLTKEEVEVSLQLLKDYLSPDDYARIVKNFNPRAKAILNRNFQKYVRDQLQTNKIMGKLFQSDVNAAYLKAFAQNLPKESYAGLQFAASPSYKTIENLIHLTELHRKQIYNFIEQWHELPKEFYKLGYRPLVQYGEIGEKMMLLEEARKINRMSSINSNEWLPRIGYAKSPEKLKVMMTFHRKYLDHGVFLNSLIDTKLFNTTPLAMYSQFIKNIDDLLTRPAVGYETFGNNWITLIPPAEKTLAKIGSIDAAGFIVMSGKQAVKLLKPMNRIIGKNGGLIGKYPKNSQAALHFAKNFKNLQKDLQTVDWKKLITVENTENAIKSLQETQNIFNFATPEITKNLQKLQQNIQLLDNLPNSQWVKEIIFTSYDLETFQKFYKAVEASGKIKVHGAIEQILRPATFQKPQIRRFFNFMDTVTGFWKGSILWSNFTGYHGRNIIGNALNANVGGVSMSYYIRRFPQTFIKVAKFNLSLRKIGKTQNAMSLTNIVDDKSFIAAAKRILTKTEYKNFLPIYQLRRRGVMGHSVIREETWGLMDAFDRFSQTLDPKKHSLFGKPFSTRRKMWTKATKIYGLNMELNQYFDDVHRMLIHDYFTKNPQHLARLGYANIDQATRIIGFDFNQLTKFEQKYVRRLIPFYSWARQNFEYHLFNFAKNSHRYKAILRVYTEWQRSMQELKEGDLLSWQEERNYLALGKNLVKIEIPFLTYNEIFSYKVLGRINPFMRTVLETATKKNFFYDRAIDDNELVNNAFDSFSTYSVQKKRWENYLKTIFGLTNRELGAASDWAPSLFTKFDRAKNQQRNLYEKVQKAQKFLATLKTQGSTIPTWTNIATIRPRINRKWIISQ